MQSLQKSPIKVNQAYIAKKLNLSTGTVSKALRGCSEINSETIRKIQEFAQSIGYPFSSHFQNQAGYYFAGVLINSSTYRAARSGYLEGISKEAIRQNFTIFTHYVDQQESEQILDSQNIPWALRNESLVSGLIFIHHWPDNVIKDLSQKYFCVSIMHDYSNLDVDFIGVNGESGIFTLMNYLYKKGYREFGFFGHNKALSWSRSRFSGYMNTLCKMDLRIDSDRIIEVEKEYPDLQIRHWDSHFDQIAQLVKKGVNAWICASELAAYELCTGLKARGLGIPDDVAITGFDSNVGNSNGQWHITSMKVPSQEMGSAALRIIQSRKENSEIPRQVLLFDCEFVEGNTA